MTVRSEISRSKPCIVLWWPATPLLAWLTIPTAEYLPVDCQALLRKRGILISMSGRGNCYDNSMDEA